LLRRISVLIQEQGHRESLMKTTMKTMALLAIGLLPGLLAAQDNLIVNGDFETGDMSGWSTFVTANGGLGIGFPSVVSFDVAGDGASNAAKFKVGQIVFTPGVPEGGGIYQSFTFSGGEIAINMDIAVQADSANGTAGFFELFVDDVLLDSFDFGDIAAATTERASLGYSGELAAGVHELRVQMTRTARIGPTPYQYLDNISVETVLDPGTLLQQLLNDVTDVGPGKSLAAKVGLAQTYYATPDVQATCAMLSDFQREVGAQAGKKKLTDAQAARFTSDANAIMEAIDCN
jgi:hypothetical protein